jgi:hypothetical protein
LTAFQVIKKQVLDNFGQNGVNVVGRENGFDLLNTIAHDKGKPVAKQGRKAVSL